MCLCSLFNEYKVSLFSNFMNYCQDYHLVMWDLGKPKIKSISILFHSVVRVGNGVRNGTLSFGILDIWRYNTLYFPSY